MKTKALALSLIAACAVLPACGPKKKSKKSTASRVVMFVHGDPKRMIEGSTQNTESFLTVDNMDGFNDFHIAGMSDIREQDPLRNPSGFDEVEDQNSTETDDEGDEVLPRYSFVPSSKGYVFQPKVAAKGLPSLEFNVANGKLVLTGIEGIPVAVEHYSLKDDGKGFSFLMSFNDKDHGRRMLSVSFADSSVQKLLVSGSPAYNYLYGHYKIGWDSEMYINLCSKTATDMQKASVQKSVAAWFADPTRLAGDSVRPVKYGVKTQYAPFSDMNEHCIYLISAFKDESSTNFYTAGVTFPVLNFTTNKQIDSDVFIFMDHVGRELNRGLASPTTTHEMGHFFGLGHEFETDEPGHKHYLSIMGYSDGTDVIMKEDFEAIRALYGMSLGASPSL